MTRGEKPWALLISQLTPKPVLKDDRSSRLYSSIGRNLEKLSLSLEDPLFFRLDTSRQSHVACRNAIGGL